MSPVAINALLGLAMVLAILGALKIQGFAVGKRLLSGSFSRKLAHVTLGIVLLASWSLYLPSPGARWIAALVPGALLAYFVFLGIGAVKDDVVVQAGSRTGNRREFLHGPTFYALSFSVLTAIFWRTSPVGMAALMIMVLGDGLGEVAGKSIPGPRIPWNRNKSVAGSAAVLVGGWTGAAAMTAVFTALGFLTGQWEASLLPLLLVATAGAVVESLPLVELDNLTIPAVCAVVGQLVLV